MASSADFMLEVKTMLKQLSEYRELTEIFGKSVSNLKIFIKQEESVEFKTINRFSISAYDCLYAFDIAAEFSIYLLGVEKNWLNEKKLNPQAEIRPKYFEIRRLELMYKSLFYFLRVFQDEANRLLLEIMGLKSGPNSSMVKTLKSEQSPIKIKIQEEFPEYNKWFLDLRERRNKIKSYGDFDTVFDENDIKIRFVLIDEGDDNLNLRNAKLNVSPIYFGEYFEDAIIKCTKLNKVIFKLYRQQFPKNY